MNKHYEISHQKIIQAYKEESKSRRKIHCIESILADSYEKVNIFSNKNLSVYYKDLGAVEDEVYYLYNKITQSYRIIYKSKLTSKSIREKLHNIQENKQHEQTLRD